MAKFKEKPRYVEAFPVTEENAGEHTGDDAKPGMWCVVDNGIRYLSDQLFRARYAPASAEARGLVAPLEPTDPGPATATDP